MSALNRQYEVSSKSIKYLQEHQKNDHSVSNVDFVLHTVIFL